MEEESGIRLGLRLRATLVFPCASDIRGCPRTGGGGGGTGAERPAQGWWWKRRALLGRLRPQRSRGEEEGLEQEEGRASGHPPWRQRNVTIWWVPSYECFSSLCSATSMWGFACHHSFCCHHPVLCPRLSWLGFEYTSRASMRRQGAPPRAWRANMRRASKALVHIGSLTQPSPLAMQTCCSWGCCCCGCCCCGCCGCSCCRAGDAWRAVAEGCAATPWAASGC